MPKIPGARTATPTKEVKPATESAVEGNLYAFPDSSNIQVIRYVEAEAKLYVTFSDGTYSYNNVSREAFEELIKAGRTSIGSAFHRLIRKGAFAFRKETDYEQPALNEAVVIRKHTTED